ncbi:hypothetical protein Phum_PHUM450430 [Pediculus humanus corporis]|uniref:Transmembrane protein n=1 Tax=Pediculus humanus subsp. corporis TaxID=121224 RepID=E0VUF7_PEDHC|nr:uncharacterized protein Phum_PHUM450430 [Pediculus humanus corporis]EEB17013.1 hypothetical protein Phum_PHUM450430 [Pediculus humanus corporis]
MNFLNVIPQGHEKALKQAFYNAVAMFVLVLCAAAGWALYFILEPFVKPLLWALLIGSVLHPFKYSLAERFETWFHQFNASSTPIFLEFFMVPIRLIDRISELIGNALVTNFKILLTAGIGMLLFFFLFFYTPCITLMGYIWYINNYVLLLIMHYLTIHVFLIFLILYATILIFYWNNENKQLLSVVSYGIWFFISLFVAKIFGVLQIPLFLIILFALSFGFAFEVFMMISLSCEKISYWRAVENVFKGNSPGYTGDKDSTEKQTDDLHFNQKDETKSDVNKKTEETNVKKNEGKTFASKPCLVRSSSDFLNKLDLYAALEQKLKLNTLRLDGAEKGSNNENSFNFIYGVIWACFLMIIWKNVWIIHILPIPFAIYFIKHLGIYFGIWNLINSQMLSMWNNMFPFLKMRELAIFPPPIQGLCKLFGKLRISVMNGIHHSISSFASSLVILGLILFVFCFSFFIAFQIYAEGIHLVTVGAEVINTTVVNNPEFLQMLPEGWGDKMESIINDAYIYGREGISNQVSCYII